MGISAQVLLMGLVRALCVVGKCQSRVSGLEPTGRRPPTGPSHPQTLPLHQVRPYARAPGVGLVAGTTGSRGTRQGQIQPGRHCCSLLTSVTRPQVNDLT